MTAKYNEPGLKWALMKDEKRVHSGLAFLLDLQALGPDINSVALSPSSTTRQSDGSPGLQNAPAIQPGT